MSAHENRIDSKDIARWAEALREAKLDDVLRWAAERFAGQAAFATSLGLEDQVILDALARHRIAMPVFTLDTGRLFPETYDLLAAIRERYGVTPRVVFPEREAVEEMVERHGVNLFRGSVDLRRECCRVRKVEPLKRALSGLSAWVTGLRQGQSGSRHDVAVVEWDEGNGLLKINPLAFWTEAEVRDYIRRHDVPYNPLHDRGFPSIGCACCTRATAPGEDVRAGRWWWEGCEKKECGLHPGPLKKSASSEGR